MHVFFDEKGAIVRDPNLLQKLALGAWTRENVVTLTDPRNGSRRVSGILATSQALQRYETVQDILARAMAEAIEVAVTGGATLDKGFSSLAWSFIRGQLASPRTARTVFTLAAQSGLQMSLNKYNELNPLLDKLPADSTAFVLADLEMVKRLYTQARGLELPYEALAVVLMPKSAHELTDQALQSMLSELVAGLPLPDSNELVTLKSLLSLQQSLATFGQSFPALQRYHENFNLAINLAQANDRKINNWVMETATACP